MIVASTWPRYLDVFTTSLPVLAEGLGVLVLMGGYPRIERLAYDQRAVQPVYALEPVEGLVLILGDHEAVRRIRLLAALPRGGLAYLAGVGLLRRCARGRCPALAR